MGVAFHPQPEMLRGAVLRLIQYIFAPTDQLHHSQRQVRKSERVRLSTSHEERFEGQRIRLRREGLAPASGQFHDPLPAFRRMENTPKRWDPSAVEIGRGG